MRRLHLVLAFAAALVATSALAHTASDSYLTLDVREERLAGRWDIALRDADLALDLDADGDGAITWGELRMRERDLAAWASAFPVAAMVALRSPDDSTTLVSEVGDITRTSPRCCGSRSNSSE